MKNQIECNWLGDMAFETAVDNHKIVMDAGVAAGGKDRGPRPKALLLVAQAGCTGMDVVAILAKMRVKFESFRIVVEGDMTEEHPRYYKSICIKYIFSGENLDMKKINKAVDLSLKRYCGVTAQLKTGVPVTSEIIIE